VYKVTQKVDAFKYDQESVVFGNTTNTGILTKYNKLIAYC